VSKTYIDTASSAGSILVHLAYSLFFKAQLTILGSWFVLEPWISPTPFLFAKTPGQSDLDIARGSHAREVLENHWDAWIVEEDWKWMKERGINTVRIPVRTGKSTANFNSYLE
jgi:aryl-phospho-beta-D-glucosidase BglC (GH1 family)